MSPGPTAPGRMSSRRSLKRTRSPSAGIVVATRKLSKRALLSQHLAERPPGPLTEPEFALLCERLAPISEAYLRNLVRSCGLPLDPVVEGVRQESFEELGRTLLALAEEHQKALNAGDQDHAARCRQAVLKGKEHAQLAARRRDAPPERRTQKEEMASWMLIWLENPEIFPAWLALRKKAVDRSPG